MSAMDLSIEAEAFGCAIAVSDWEVTTMTGRLITNLDQAVKLAVPQPGDRRTGVYLEVVRLLARQPGQPLVLAGCMGPFSLAARLVGVRFLAIGISRFEPPSRRDPPLPGRGGAQVHGERSHGADPCRTGADARVGGKESGLSGELHRGVSGRWRQGPPPSRTRRRVALTARNVGVFERLHSAHGCRCCERLVCILPHNCAARVLHLSAILETGLTTCHFGAPMDMAAALGKVAPEVVLCGDLDPSGVFVQMAPVGVSAKATELLAATASYRNFVLSSGCDVPPNVPLASLDAFYAAVNAAGNGF